jgi:hypothetical protein
MKHVLVIAYHFPPGGGPGVQRVLKHVTYLRDFGWQPIVLTVDGGDFPARDESLLAKIPNDVEVHRASIFEPYDLYRRFMGKKGAAVDVNVNKSSTQRSGIKERLSEWIRATFFIPDARIMWLWKASAAAMRIIDDRRASGRPPIDAIYTSSPPYTCALIGRKVKRKTSLPWVAGFRDPWTGFLTTPDRWFLPAMIDRRMERRVFQEADAVECAWKGIIDDARSKLPNIDAQKFHHVPNGFDSADLPTVPYQRNDVFTITYTGSMYGRRTPRALLESLELMHERKALDINQLKLRFIGRFGDDVLDMMKRSAVAPCIEVVGYVPHEESIRSLMTSELNLLVVDDAKESAEIVPGKVYEYLGVGRPILALAPSGSAIEELIIETHAGFSRPQSDIEGIAQAIARSMSAWAGGEPLVTPYADRIERYERRESARQLARILDGLTHP